MGLSEVSYESEDLVIFLLIDLRYVIFVLVIFVVLLVGEIW